MAKDLFSVPIFFIVFRETLEAAIIISVLLGLAEQIVDNGELSRATTTTSNTSQPDGNRPSEEASEDNQVQRRRLVRRLRVQIFLGAGLGFLVAFAIGAAFIAVWFTRASNLWAKSEEIWEGVFELIASLMIFVMGVSMLKMERARAKWRIKLQNAFDSKVSGDREGKTGKWALFILPFITVLREGLEAVIFVGGVALGQPATSIPIATIVGIVAGFICGYLIYQFASRATLTIFLIAMTNLLLLIGAGLFSRAVGAFEKHAFNQLLGAEVDDAGGDGPGSYDVRGNVWHLDCCNPDNNLDSEGWSVFNAIFGWTNNATLGTVLSYVFYWIAVMITLVYFKFKEGRTTLFGRESTAGARRRYHREKNAHRVDNVSQEKVEESDESSK
ncbi:high-affinity iron permease [Paramarasmius palmivorus]|uniref:High-affinity iron permease n=1 Tax=Paramarasmius palmivorus TaxID=297713 RepID=A0AAW0CCK2_9AGAR